MLITPKNPTILITPESSIVLIKHYILTFILSFLNTLALAYASTHIARHTFAPLVSKETVEKIIERVTSFIQSNGITEFSKEDVITLPDDITTTDMMHFGWNIAKPFKKYNLHTAHFLKNHST